MIDPIKLTGAEHLEDWENSQFLTWWAVDKYKQGEITRLCVTCDERYAKEKATNLVSGMNLTNYCGEDAEWGEYDLPEEVPFFRCMIISAEEAHDYLQGIQGDHPDLITQKTAAELLGVSKGRVSQLVKSGQLESCGRLVYRASVEARLESEPKAGRPW